MSDLYTTAAQAIHATSSGFELLRPILPTLLRIAPAAPPGMTGPEAVANCVPAFRLTDAAEAAGVDPTRYRAYLRQMIPLLDQVGVHLREYRLDRGSLSLTDPLPAYTGQFVSRQDKAALARQLSAAEKRYRTARDAAKGEPSEAVTAAEAEIAQLRAHRADIVGLPVAQTAYAVVLTPATLYALIGVPQ